MYIAPEVLSNFYGKECDMWSLGITLNFLLTGNPIFDADNCERLYRKIKSGKYSLDPSLSKGARDLISKMLVVDPSKRITASQALQHYWVEQPTSVSADREILDRLFKYRGKSVLKREAIRILISYLPPNKLS